jgi:hypothetical protein
MAFDGGPSDGSPLRVAVVQQCLKINQTSTKQQLQGILPVAHSRIRKPNPMDKTESLMQ